MKTPKFTNPLGARFNVGSSICQWHEQPTQFTRSIKWCDKIASRTIRHRGWSLIDEGYGATARGVVFAISHGRFLAGIADPYQFASEQMRGPCVVCVDETFETELDAALRADSIAECYAEKERESAEHFRAEDAAREAENEATEKAYWAERDVLTVE